MEDEKEIEGYESIKGKGMYSGFLGPEMKGGVICWYRIASVEAKRQGRTGSVEAYFSHIKAYLMIKTEFLVSPDRIKIG